MKFGLAFDDICLVPADFSEVNSRQDVDTSQEICGYKLKLPVISSCMDSVYSPKLAKETAKNGGISIVHRFCDIPTNVKLFQDGCYNETKPWVSVGVGATELERATALVEAGATVLVLDLANGACSAAVTQYRELRHRFPKTKIVVGNFSTADQINQFVFRAGTVPDAFKLGQGVGSACVTRIKTGIGYPSVTCIQECVATGYDCIFDGGIRESGDLAKALALGCKAVLSGRLFAGCIESGAVSGQYSPSKMDYIPSSEAPKWEQMYGGKYTPTHKKYRGSASLSSYLTQGKISSFRTPEGEEYWIPITGTVQNLMDNLGGGLRSSMSYLNSLDLNSFRKSCNIIQISSSSILEASAFGKKE